MDPVDRPYLPIADSYIRAGEVAKAERVLGDYEREVPEDLKKSDFQRIYSHAMVALGKGQYAQALAGFREFRDKNGGEVNGLVEIGQAFEGLNQSDSALASYEAYATRPDIGPAGRQYFLPRTLRRLGELYETRNNKDKALEYYGRFTALWKDADPDLMPQVQDVNKRMATLVAEPRRP